MLHTIELQDKSPRLVIRVKTTGRATGVHGDGVVPVTEENQGMFYSVVWSLRWIIGCSPHAHDIYGHLHIQWNLSITDTLGS